MPLCRSGRLLTAFSSPAFVGVASNSSVPVAIHSRKTRVEILPTQHNKVGTPHPGVPTSTTTAQPSASRAFCSSGVSLAMPMPVADQRRAKKMAIQLEIAQGM